jgi:hypothetical protein
MSRKDPEQKIIKRVIALEGDIIRKLRMTLGPLENDGN